MSGTTIDELVVDFGGSMNLAAALLLAAKTKTVNKDSVVNFIKRFGSEHGEDRVQTLLNRKDEKKYSILHIAIFHRNLAVVEALIESGADSDLKCHGTPPLQLAIRTAGQPEGYDFGVSCVSLLLKAGANYSAKDDNGSTIFHLMAMYNFCDMMSLVLNLVDEKGVLSVTGKYDGFTALHVAAMYNAVEVAKLLLDRGVSTKAKGKVCGSLPVHLAAKYRAREVYSYLSSIDPAAIEAKDNLGLTAKEVLESLPADLALPPKSSTGVFSSYWCNHHHTIAPSEVHTGQVPPENVWRLHVLINHLDGVLFSKTLRDRVRYDLKATSASLCDILQVHEWSYIRRIQAACEELVDDAEDPKGMTHLDGDTAISKESYRAALGAAGAVCQAIDEVLQGQVRNAFCPIRPPGHHVGSRGAVKSNTGSDSHGFCLINNVSIGAAHAMNRYRDTVRRVVIVDFDVHHGNGTESTVRNLRPNVERVSVNELGVFGSICVPSYKPWRDENDADNVLFVSVHGYGPPQRGMENLFPRAAFYPGTGATSLPKVKARQQMAGEDTNKDPISSPPVEYTVAQSNKKSEDGEAPDEEASSESSGGMRVGDDDDDDDDDDSDFVGDEDGDGIDNGSNGEQFSSIGAGGIFDSKLADTFYMYDLSAHNSRAVSRAPSPMILDIGVPLPDNVPFDEDTVHSRLLADFQYRHQWRNYFRDHIFPRIATFQPDLVLISAGFDAHRKDTINAGYIALGEEDFVWVTEHLLLLAEEHCAGRVVSVLEGGYQIGGEFSSAFARSVAAHVETLARAPLSPLYSSKVMALEKACEEKYMEELKSAHEAELDRRRMEQQQFFERQKELYEQNRLAELQQNVGASVQEEKVADVDETAGRKRKRGSVDYAALEEKLKKEGTL